VIYLDGSFALAYLLAEDGSAKTGGQKRTS